MVKWNGSVSLVPKRYERFRIEVNHGYEEIRWSSPQ
jgi:hypothetical protein